MRKYRRQGTEMIESLKKEIEYIDLADKIIEARLQKGIDRIPADILVVIDEIRKLEPLGYTIQVARACKPQGSRSDLGTLGTKIKKRLVVHEPPDPLRGNSVSCQGDNPTPLRGDMATVFIISHYAMICNNKFFTRQEPGKGERYENNRNLL